MALNWIKWVKGLSRRREVLALSQSLAVDRRVVACACMELWEWADDNTTDGNIPGLTTAEIDALTALTGFAVALAAVGWLKILHNGIQFPRWRRHNSDSAKRRATSAARQARKRAKDAGNPPHSASRSACDKSVTRQEKTRGDKKWRWALRKLDVMELKRPPALLVRYRALVGLGYIVDCEARQHEFFGFAARALAEGDDPPALFYSLATKWDSSKLTNRNADSANQMLKEALYAQKRTG